jgi:putative beta-lysine N-acetyltransferase
MPTLQPDIVETLAGAQIQHGPYNRRIYLMKLGDASPAELLPKMLRLCKERDYTKIFAKVPVSQEPAFLELGFQPEARIPGFFSGTEDAVFLGLYLDPARRKAPDQEQIEEVRLLSESKTPTPAPKPSADLVLRRCRPQDIPDMAPLYGQVFATYPFPIADPDFLAETMATHVVYFGVWSDGELVALSSAETDREARNVEMTDFATLPERRGNGYARMLLARMETAMRNEGICTAYTIARAISPGMNITFARQGYRFGGCLVNNTNICGKIESMNIWHRPLLQASAT